MIAFFEIASIFVVSFLKFAIIFGVPFLIIVILPIWILTYHIKDTPSDEVADENDYEKEWVLEIFREKFNKAKRNIGK